MDVRASIRLWLWFDRGSGIQQDFFHCLLFLVPSVPSLPHLCFQGLTHEASVSAASSSELASKKEQKNKSLLLKEQPMLCYDQCN